ncbi:hypothetical protein ATJ97_0297 [Georgenia soli]|uniref:Colicin import membrane protein n=1 Tax=Georgenia soli TaxID=638953 RepID=A0A2A9F348_9MICO|nr:hypothetical protein [Georgenia soli]PFG44875.1 hypothetical protein ATJ97_0148 [Georgenia soli]PFG45016.1 hypothetical protein ATJ97_0297 [Georgenia soli]
MVEESDGIEEAVTGSVRVAVTVGARMGEMLARAREERLRRAEAADEQQARELTARLHAEQAAALAPAFRTEWWDQAGPEDIQHVYTAARAWTGQDPEADRAADRIRDEVRRRYGVDVDRAAADPDLVRVALERAEARRAQAEQERGRVAEEQVQAQLLVAEAGMADQAAATARAAAQHEPDPAERAEATLVAEQEQIRATAAREAGKDNYDSAERRQAFAADLERRGLDYETVAARITADVSQGTHPSAAVKPAGKKAPKARKSRGPEQRQQELSR